MADDFRIRKLTGTQALERLHYLYAMTVALFGIAVISALWNPLHNPLTEWLFTFAASFFIGTFTLNIMGCLIYCKKNAANYLEWSQ